MKKVSLTILLFLLLLSAYGQQQLFQPALSLSGGGLWGRNNKDYTLTLNATIKRNGWQAGVGGGIDNYELRSIPLYGIVVKEFSFGEHTPFIYSKAGTHFLWEKKKWRVNNTEWLTYNHRQEDAFFGEAGIGYRHPINNRFSLIFHVGYSHKRGLFIEEMHYSNANIDNQQILNRFRYNRIITSIGIGF